MHAITVIFVDKKQARKLAKDLRKVMTDADILNRQKEIITFLMNYEPFLNAKKIGLYHPIDNEVNLLILIHLFPDKTFYLPKTEPNKTLTFRYVSDFSSLVKGKFGLLEPSKTMPIEENIDCYLVPCVATSGLYRIGHGAGFYDNYFKTHQGYKIGIVHTLLKDLYVEMDPFDIPMDYII